MSGPIQPGSVEWHARMDAYLTRIRGVIAEAGWALQGVFPTHEQAAEEPGFIYTVGASAPHIATRAGGSVHGVRDDPELIVFGLPMEIGGGILNELVRDHRAGTRVLEVGRRYHDVIANWDVVFVAVDPAQVDEYLTVANRIAREDRPARARVRALQLVWPDPDGRFPWEDGFNEAFHVVQPVLGTPADTYTD